VQGSDTNFFAPSFDLTNVFPSQSGVIGQQSLGPFACCPQDANPPSYPHADVCCHGNSMAVRFGLTVIYSLHCRKGTLMSKRRMRAVACPVICTSEIVSVARKVS
jgi:hypothetical protein